MKKIFLLLLTVLPVLIYCQKKIEYPKPEKSDTSDEYFGTKIPDPYRWLEDINSPKTVEWLAKEAEITAQFETGKGLLENGICEKLKDYGWAGTKRLWKHGAYYFRTVIYDEDKPPVLFYRKSFNGVESVIVDPEKFKEDKNDALTIKSYEVSGNSRYLAFSLSSSGADWTDIHVMNLETREPTNDLVRNVKFAELSWKADGFFYIRSDSVDSGIRITAANRHPKLFYHKVGEDVKNDRLIYVSPYSIDENWINYSVTYGEKYLIIHDYQKKADTTYEKVVMYASLDSFPSVHFRTIIRTPLDSKVKFSIFGTINNSFLVKTDLNAPSGRILLYTPSEGENNFREIVPQFRNILEQAGYSDDKILCLYTLRGQYMACIFAMDGKMIKQIRFPAGNLVYGFHVVPGDKESYYYVSSFYYPSVAHYIDLETMKNGLLTNTFIGFDQTLFETKYVSFRSFDNTEIPMFLTYRKGLKLKGNNPVLMYGYGGFGINLTPFFRPETILWLENGGVFAVPGIRGGGEKGSSWHEQGSGLNKMNSFNDFIAAARYLVDSNYSSPEKLAIEGGSNGGLLVGVAITQHPELFKAAVAEMGVFDMLRYDKFSAGALWKNEYGASSDEKEFRNLLGYSPLHNLKKGVHYPATLIITADNDDRVPPLHSYKFIASLQELGDCANPYFLKVVKKGGHQGTDILNLEAKRVALKFLFLFKNLKMDPASVY